jgi:phage replication O-like protein O
MASPQLEHGFMRLANELAEVLARAPLNGSQFRILLLLLRECYGRNGGQKKALLSLRKVAAITGLDLRQVRREAHNLITAGMISRQSANGSGTLYGFVKDYDVWTFGKKRFRGGGEFTPGGQFTLGVNQPPQEGVSSPPQRRKNKSSEAKTASSSSKAQDASDQGNALAELLKKRILTNNPKAKVTDAQLQKWALEAERMTRLDGRTEAEVRELIEWSQGDSFWKSNILSMAKLREKFDQLYLKSRGSGHGTGVGNRKPSGAIPPPAGKYDHQKPDFTFNVDHQ